MSEAREVRLRLDALAERLRARHGWTHVEVEVRVDAEARRIALGGELAVARLRAPVVEAAREAAPGWEIDGEALTVMAGGAWHALTGPVVLRATCPAVDPSPPVATELRAQDGPVQHLGTKGALHVVRGRDGTVGWLEGPLGPVVEAPRLAPPHGDDPQALIDAARPWLGTPYRLGGVTEDAIDCSALVQRLALEVLGVLLPRHSNDQLLVASRPQEGRAPGDLSFVWSEREALCHVGIGTGPTVIHASLSRRRVVEDAMPEFLAGSRKTMHVPFGELLAFGRRIAGAPSLVAAGFWPGVGQAPAREAL